MPAMLLSDTGKKSGSGLSLLVEHGVPVQRGGSGPVSGTSRDEIRGPGPFDPFYDILHGCHGLFCEALEPGALLFSGFQGSQDGTGERVHQIS